MLHGLRCVPYFVLVFCEVMVVVAAREWIENMIPCENETYTFFALVCKRLTLKLKLNPPILILRRDISSSSEA